MQNSPAAHWALDAHALRPCGSSSGSGVAQAETSRSGSKHSPVAMQQASGGSHGSPPQNDGPGGSIGPAPLEPPRVPLLPPYGETPAELPPAELPPAELPPAELPL